MVRRLDEIGAGQVIDDFAVDERRADVVAPDSAGVDQPLGAVATRRVLEFDHAGLLVGSVVCSWLGTRDCNQRQGHKPDRYETQRRRRQLRHGPRF